MIRVAGSWKRPRRAAVAVAMAMAMGASPALLSCTRAEGECGPGGTCPEGRSCHPTYNLCYVPDAPVVSWASPQVDETLTGATAVVSGIIDSGGQYTAEISIGRPDLWQPLSVSSAGQFSTAIALPLSNGEPQPLRVRTTRTTPSGASVAVSSIYRAVDNVPPSLSFSERAPRPTPTTVRLVASEPMSSTAPAPGAVPLGGSEPAVQGVWNADRTEVRYEGLAHDATYQVQVPAGGLPDRAGNPTAAAFTVTFTTEPVAPAPDATIPVGGLDLTDLEASSDGEGAVSVVLASAQGIVVWGELDARTGLFRALSQATGNGLLGFQTISAPMPDQRWGDGTSKRAGGVMLSRVAGGAQVQSVIYQDVYPGAARGTFASVNPGGLSYLPGPGNCAEPPGPTTLELDAAGGQIVLRHGGQPPTPAALPAAPSWTLFHSAAAGEWVSLAGGTLSRVPRICTCGAQPACALGAAQAVGSGVAAGSRISAASTPADDRAYAYDTATGRALTCMRGCGGGACTNVGSESGSLASELSVAGANQGSLVLQAERSGTSVVLFLRDLQQGCGSGPSPAQELGRLTSGSSIRRFRPVMFGRRPGLLYLSTAGGPGVLRTFIP